jgi:hypothetical protein
MWAAGIAAAAGLVAWWRVVGVGFAWLSGGVVLLFGVPGALAGAGTWAWAGSALAAAAALLGSRRAAAVPLFSASGAALAAAAMPDGGVAATLSGALLLGGITSEMLLGHWFLVDPRLPRWSLLRLDLLAVAGVIADTAVVALLGAFPWESGDLAVGLGYLALVAMTLLLTAGVWASLREEGYPAVMAATGLSYLAVLTAAGAVVLGRLLVEGSVLG